MSTQKVCQHCGTTLSDDAPGGCCPACMLKVAMATGTGGEAGDAPHHGFTPPTVQELQGRFPGLEILEFIGRGGMGAVYKARQKELDRIVALKILPPDIGQDAAFAERFAREAKAMARLNHPGIVTIHDFGRADGLYFFLMEFVDGINLRQLLQNGRIAPREALAIVPEICDALQYAHDQGIVHRDIKPENILLDRRGRVKVADFGLAKLMSSGAEAPPQGPPGGSSDLTEAGKVMGTPNYIAPEQISRPQEVDHRADIYSLGVVLYQMLTGELPGKSLEPPSRKVRVDVRIDEVVLRALEKDPERRYQQASVLKTQVETISEEERKQDSQKEPKGTETRDAGTTGDPGSARTGPSAPRAEFPRTLPSIQSVQNQFLALTISWWIGFPLSLIGEAVPALNIIALPALIVTAVFGCILLYRHWALLQGHGARTTPGKAVGFSFIPVFFFYWWFVAYAGLATDNNRRLRELGITSVRLSRSLAIAYCILSILLCTIGLIPWVGAILTIPIMVVGYFLMLQQRNCVLALIGAETGSERGRPPVWATYTAAPLPTDPVERVPARARVSWAAIVGFCLLFCAMLSLALGVLFVFRSRATTSGAFALSVPGLLLVLGTVVFGVIGLVQTRRAPERYRGFGLAVFDLLFFPLLLLSAGLAIIAAKLGLDEPYILLGALAVNILLTTLLWKVLKPAGGVPESPGTREFRGVAPVAGLILSVTLCIVGLLSLRNVMSVRPHENSSVGLADRPDLLRKAPTPAVLETAAGDLEGAWAWQELRNRAESGSLSLPEVDALLHRIALWLRQHHPQGYGKPIPWFSQFAEVCAKKGLVSEANVYEFVQALHGGASIEPLNRVHQEQRWLHLSCNWRNHWNRSFFGLVILNNMMSVSIDGTPLSPEGQSRQYWGAHAFNGQFKLPELAPGTHKVRCEILSTLLPETDLAGLEPDAPSSDWPVSKSSLPEHMTRWRHTTDADLIVLSPDQEVVSLVTDPDLDPVSFGGLAVEKAFIRTKGEGAVAVVVMALEGPFKVPISFGASIELGGKTFEGKAVYAVRNGNSLSYSGKELLFDIDKPTPSVTNLNLFLKPNPEGVEHLPGIQSIWGKSIRFDDVPVVRQDLNLERTVRP